MNKTERFYFVGDVCVGAYLAVSLMFLGGWL